MSSASQPGPSKTRHARSLLGRPFDEVTRDLERIKNSPEPEDILGEQENLLALASPHCHNCDDGSKLTQARWDDSREQLVVQGQRVCAIHRYRTREGQRSTQYTVCLADRQVESPSGNVFSSDEHTITQYSTACMPKRDHSAIQG